MPIRLLKPGVRDSDAIESLSPLCEVLFYRLLVTVDDFGRYDARPAMIKSQCFPIKDAVTASVCTELLAELSRAGLVCIYEVNGKPYMQMLKWDNVPRAKESKFPPIDHACKHLYADASQPKANVTLTVTDTVTDTETEDRKPKPEISAAQSARREQVAAVFDHWRFTMSHMKSVLDDKRRKLIEARMKDGYSTDDLRNAITGCSLSPYHMGQNEQGTRYDGLDLILRDGSKVDKFIAIQRNPPRPVGRQGLVEARNQAAVDEFLSGSPGDIIDMEVRNA